MILSNLDKKAALIHSGGLCEYIAGDYKILRMDKRPAQRIKEREYEHIQCSDNDRWLGHVFVWNGCDGRWSRKTVRR